MATSPEYLAFVLEQLPPLWEVRSKKMFGEYMIYLNDKPVLTLCDNTVFVKKLPVLSEILAGCALRLSLRGREGELYPGRGGSRPDGARTAGGGSGHTAAQTPEKGERGDLNKSKGRHKPSFVRIEALCKRRIALLLAVQSAYS